MSHRIFWPVVAALSLAGVIAFLSQSPAQRGGGRAGGAAEPGMPGMAGPHGMPGRFVVANASSSQVLILDTATGQVYRAKEEDFKKMSDMPRMGGDPRPTARDRRPEPRDKEEARPRDGRRPPPKDKGEPPARRPAKDKDEAPPQREER